MSIRKTSAPGQVVIYGHSDDCIEVDGALTEEFYAYDKPKFLHFSDGTVIMCQYGVNGQGIWRIVPHKIGSVGQAAISRELATNEDYNYTDRVTINSKLDWVECWSSADGPTVDELHDEIKHRVETNAFYKIKDTSLLLAFLRAMQGRFDPAAGRIRDMEDFIRRACSMARMHTNVGNRITGEAVKRFPHLRDAILRDRATEGSM